MYDQIRKDLVETMKSGDKFKLNVIRMIKAALMNEETSMGRSREQGLSDEEVIAVIKREVKKRNSSIEEYTKYNRMDTVEELKKEVEILSTYLPEEMSEEELTKHIEEVIAEIGAETIKDMGKVMKEITAKYGSVVDMSKASQIVKSKLN